MKRVLIAALSILALTGGARVALGGSTPVGALPVGPTANIDVQHGELLAVALPKRSAGHVWRVARPFDAKILREVSEANVGSSTVLVFRASGAGRTTVAFALTKGDVSAKALESRRYFVLVH